MTRPSLVSGLLRFGLLAWVVFGAIVAGVSGSSSSLSSSQPSTATSQSSQPGGLVLRDVLWQLLPQEVSLVYVGPDDRLWRVVSTGGRATTLSMAKSNIQEQFSQPSPRLEGVRVALFEDNGRVWFSTIDGKYLLGYDGKPGSWIEKTSDEGKAFVGNCPGHGRLRRAGHNLQLGQRLFFLDSNGAHCFYKGQWTYKEFTDLPYKPRGLEPYYQIVPAKAGLVAFMARTAEPVYFWQGGLWTRLGLKELEGSSRQKAATGDAPYLMDAAPLGDDLLVQFRALKGGDLRRIALPSIDETPTEFAGLVRALGDDNWKVREKATEDLLRVGRSIARPVETMLEDKNIDLEVRVRLEMILEKLSRPYLDQFELAGRKLTRVIGLQSAPDCTVLIAFSSGEADRDRAGECGLMVIPPHGDPKVFKGVQYLDGWDPLHQEQSFPMFARDGRTVYLPGLYGNPPARVLDLVTGNLTELPDGNFCWLHGVMSDGTLLSSIRQGGSGLSPGIAVYRPGRVDDRQVLQSTCVSNHSTYCIASDGTVWTFIPGKGLCQFDGKHWHTRAALAEKWPHIAWTAGTGGTVLAVLYPPGDKKRAQTFLWTGSEMLEGEILTFIKANSSLFRKAFAAPRDNQYNQGNKVAADKAGNIWVQHIDNAVHVLVGNEWKQMPPLPSPPNGTKAIRYITPLGRGSRMYCSTLNLKQDAGQAYIASVEDGAIKMKDAPCTGQGPLRLSDGTVCLNGQCLQLLSDGGEVDEVKGAGWAKCVDASGLIWTADCYGERIHVVAPPANGRKAKIVATATVPYADRYSMQVASDSARSAYVWSLSGLHHYVLNEDNELQLRETYHLRSGTSSLVAFSSSARWLDYTPLGYFIIVRHEEHDGRYGTYMHLVRVPEMHDKS